MSVAAACAVTVATMMFLWGVSMLALYWCWLDLRARVVTLEHRNDLLHQVLNALVKAGRLRLSSAIDDEATDMMEDSQLSQPSLQRAITANELRSMSDEGDYRTRIAQAVQDATARLPPPPPAYSVPPPPEPYEPSVGGITRELIEPTPLPTDRSVRPPARTTWERAPLSRPPAPAPARVRVRPARTTAPRLAEPEPTSRSRR